MDVQLKYKSRKSPFLNNQVASLVVTKDILKQEYVKIDRYNGCIITWILHLIIKYSNKVKLEESQNNDPPPPSLYERTDL